MALLFLRGVRPIHRLANAARQLNWGVLLIIAWRAREVRLAGRAFQAMHLGS